MSRSGGPAQASASSSRKGARWRGPVTPMNQPRPVERIATLDVLRGAAVLGIPAVNAAAFALPLDIQMAPD